MSVSGRTKKVILWSITSVIAVSLLILWARDTKTRLENFQGKAFIEKLNFPKIEMPKMALPAGELTGKVKELGELIKNAEEATTTAKE